MPHPKMLRAKEPVQRKRCARRSIVEAGLHLLIPYVLPILGLRRDSYAKKHDQPKKKQPVSHHKKYGLGRVIGRRLANTMEIPGGHNTETPIMLP